VNHHLSIGQSLVWCQDFIEKPGIFPPGSLGLKNGIAVIAF